MARLMGFGDFDTTKGKHVADNDTSAARGAVARTLKREYRQYMHRKGSSVTLHEAFSELQRTRRSPSRMRMILKLDLTTNWRGVAAPVLPTSF